MLTSLPFLRRTASCPVARTQTWWPLLLLIILVTAAFSHLVRREAPACPCGGSVLELLAGVCAWEPPPRAPAVPAMATAWDPVG
jgi:hypothetical protein